MSKRQQRIRTVVTILIFLAALNFALLIPAGLFRAQRPFSALIPKTVLPGALLLVAGLLMLWHPRGLRSNLLITTGLAGMGVYFLLGAWRTFVELKGKLLVPSEIGGFGRTPLAALVPASLLLIGAWSKYRERVP